MIYVLFKAINSILTMHTINYYYIRLLVIMLSYILPYPFILNNVDFFLELYLTFNVILFMCDENICVPTRFVKYTQSKDDLRHLC